VKGTLRALNTLIGRKETKEKKKNQIMLKPIQYDVILYIFSYRSECANIYILPPKEKRNHTHTLFFFSPRVVTIVHVQ